MSKTVSFQTIQFKCKYSLIVKNISILAILFSQTVLFQTIHLGISMQFYLTHR